MKLLKRVYEMWQSRKSETPPSQLAAGQSKVSQSFRKLYSSDDDIGFC